MAQYFTDFSGYTTGVQPSDWTVRWHTATWEVQEDVNAEGGKKLVNTTPDGRDLLSWDAIDGDADRADFDILMRIERTADTYDAAAVGRAEGPDTDETGWLWSTKGSPELAIFRYLTSSYSEEATVTDFTLTVGTFYWMRYRAQGTSHQAVVSTDKADVLPVSDTDPTPVAGWDLSTTSSVGEDRLGWTGFAPVGGSGGTVDVFAVGTGGDTPPTEAVSSADPANLAVSVSGSTASLSWDASPLLAGGL